MTIQIITDSTADLQPHIRQRVEVVPLPLRFGSTEYLDGVTIDHRRFYEMLVESDALPTTSQASPAAFAEEFRKARQAGKAVVALTISSRLSGTYQSACIAAEEFDNVWVVDTGTAAIGAGILVERALELADRGMAPGYIADTLTREREQVRVVAMLDTLEYLKKGGRISAAVAFAGGLLGIKPVVALQDGQILMLGKARGSKQGNNLLVSQIENAGGVDFDKPILLGYTGLSDALLRKYIDDSAALWAPAGEAPPITCIGSVIGTHAGPGTIAAAFFSKFG